MQESDILGAFFVSTGAERGTRGCSIKASRRTNVAVVSGPILCFPRLSTGVGWCALCTRLAGVISSQEIGDIFAEDGFIPAWGMTSQ